MPNSAPPATISLRTAALLGCCIVIGSLAGVSLVVAVPIAAEPEHELSSRGPKASSSALGKQTKAELARRKAEAKRQREVQAKQMLEKHTETQRKKQASKQAWEARLSSLSKSYDDAKQKRLNSTRLARASGKAYKRGHATFDYVVLKAGSNWAARVCSPSPATTNARRRCAARVAHQFTQRCSRRSTTSRAAPSATRDAANGTRTCYSSTRATAHPTQTTTPCVERCRVPQLWMAPAQHRIAVPLQLHDLRMAHAFAASGAAGSCWDIW